MPNWNQVLREVSASPLDNARRKYLQELSDRTSRNIICYYSGWLQKPNSYNASIHDDDKNGLMAAVHGLDRSKGLDLVLHTPGGDLAATESIVNYLRSMFGTNIRAIIPQIAMSAGTMIACSAKEILMGKQSNIGPIDPQFGGIPAHGVIEEFNKAVEEVKKDPGSIPIWQTVVQKYHPTFLGECEKAIKLSSEMVTNWLVTGMFENDSAAQQKAGAIVDALNNHEDTKTHARHIHIEQAIRLGLKIVPLEEDQDLQDLTLTVHHAYMHTLANSAAIKIIENHKGNAIIQNLAN
ncbi:MULTISPECIES: SDH family Clp fold serine proteinase [Methylomonas]|uniref:Serine protease n=1 Tax=Methylomonas koyamae TaxID=702114 RepID=A0A177NI04_9GAMM|nr:serine protease [Methylomonas koyamae]OAI17746.1 serine protease [Methylomonas koyamae]